MATEPKRQELTFRRKSRIFNRSQRRRKFPKIRMYRRNKLRLCSFSGLLGPVHYRRHSTDKKTPGRNRGSFF
jgi:hypothetical protein